MAVATAGTLIMSTAQAGRKYNSTIAIIAACRNDWAFRMLFELKSGFLAFLYTFHIPSL